MEEAYRGQTLFTKGETNRDNIYLLDGQITLLNDDKVIEQISAGSNTARFPIAHASPREYTARASSALRFVRLDGQRLSDVLAREHTSDYQVSDLDESAEDDWMTQLLHSPVMQQIPASNIQRVMMCVERVNVDAGTSIIRQGDPGDFYYMLNRGQAVVSRDNDDGQPPVELARLGPGSSFGEEALLSDAPRNSTITMLTNGMLVRLSKDDFVELIHHPLSTGYDLEGATALVGKGAVWLDIRPPEQHQALPLPGSLKMPFDTLRCQVETLAPERHYVVVAESRATAASGAFLLTDKGYEVSFLDEAYESREAPVGTEVFAGDPDLNARSMCAATNGDAVDEKQLRVLRARLAQLEGERDAARAEGLASLEHFEQAVGTEREHLQRLEQERARLEQQLGELRTCLQDAELEREGMRQELAAVSDREKVLKKRLRKAESQAVEARDRAESASQQYEGLARKLEKSDEQRQLESDHNARSLGELKEQITELQLELDLARGDVEEAQAQLHAAQRQQTEEHTQLQSMSSERERLQDEVARATAHAEELTEELNKLRGMASDGDQVREELVANLQATESRSLTLIAQLAERDDELEDLRAEIGRQTELARSSETDLSGKADLIADLDIRLAASDERAAAMAQQLAAAQETVAASQAEIDTKEQKLNTLTATLAERDADAAALSSVQETLEQRVAQLLQEIDDARREHDDRVADLSSRLDASGQLTHQLEAERDQAKSELAAGVEGLRGLQENLASLQAEKDTLAAELLAQLDALKSDQDAAAHALSQRDQDLAARQAELDESAALTASLQQQLAAAQNTATENQEQAAKRVQQLERELAAAQTRQMEVDRERDAGLEQAQARQEALDAARQQAQSAQRQTAELDKRLEALEQCHVATASERDALTAEVERLRIELTTTDQRAQTAEAECQTASGEIASLGERLASLDLSQSEIESARSGLAAELAQTQAQLRANEERAQSAEERYQAQEAQIAELQSQLQQSHEQLAHLREESEGRVVDQTELQTALDATQARLSEAQQRFNVLENELAQTRAAEAESVDALAQSAAEREALRAEVRRLDRELDEARTDVQAQKAKHAAQGADGAGQVERLEERLFELRAENERLRNGSAEPLERDPELVETGSRLAALQSAENHLASEAEDLRAKLASELQQAQERNAELEDQLAVLAAERDNLRQQEENYSTAAAGEPTGERSLELERNLAAVSQERDAALAEAETWRDEVDNLRSVMEKHIDQIRTVQSSAEDVEALNKELAMVRAQADNDVAQLRDELDSLRAQLAAQQRERGEAPLAEEAMRQEAASLREALAERQRELATADLARQRVEDQLEDAAREIERLRRLTSAKTEDNAPERTRDGWVHPARVQTGTDPAEAIEDLLDSGLRDRRVKASRRTLDMEKVTGKPRTVPLLLGLLIGLVLVVGGLEAVTYLSGRGELFTFLFGG